MKSIIASNRPVDSGPPEHPSLLTLLERHIGALNTLIEESAHNRVTLDELEKVLSPVLASPFPTAKGQPEEKPTHQPPTAVHEVFARLADLVQTLSVSMQVERDQIRDLITRQTVS